MAKKGTTKDTEQKPTLYQKIVSAFRSETIRFVIGLVLVIFSVYLLLAFSSFFFTGQPTRASSTAAMRRSWLR